MPRTIGCYQRTKVDLGGGLSYQHRCSEAFLGRVELIRIELGERAASHLVLSDRWPEDQARDALEELSIALDERLGR